MDKNKNPKKPRWNMGININRIDGHEAETFKNPTPFSYV